jgi:predicted lipoprotein with Yx(FWY)xxD motif
MPGTSQEAPFAMRVKTKIVIGLASVVTIALLAAAVTFAASGASRSTGSTVTISTRSVPGLGRILVNGAGRTLYMFVPDKRTRVTCFANCATVWPPLKLSAGEKVVAKGGAKAALLGSDKGAAGGRVVTYNHWPLYTYLGDSKAGVAVGQALNLTGGLWYVLAPSGAVIKTKPGGGGTTTGTTPTTSVTTPGIVTVPTNCGDGDNDGDGTGGASPDDGDGCGV